LISIIGIEKGGHEMPNPQSIAEILADSRLAFINQENETALRLAKDAIKFQPNNPDTALERDSKYLSFVRVDTMGRVPLRAVIKPPFDGRIADFRAI
jgi:hypothetical protein